MTATANETESCAGYIALMFIDDSNNECITIGGAGFLAVSERDQSWATIPTFSGLPEHTNFMADLKDADGDIIEDKYVSAETCERLMGQPIQELIAHGRKTLNKEYAQYGRTLKFC